MPVQILPQDTITPALNNVFGQLNNINVNKIQEETRKRNELAALTEVSLQNISANDNIYLQGEKEKFIQDAAKSYGENKGYLPYQTQAELTARKSNILMEARASEEWRKQYEDVVKQMATSDKIDKEKTAANLKAMMVSQGGTLLPPSQRPNPYNAVSLNFDTNAYIRQNFNKELQESTKMEGRKLITTKERDLENAFGQIKGMMADAPFKMKMTENARDAGYTDVDKYIKEQVAPNYTHKDETFTYHWPSQTNNYIINGTQSGVQGQGIVVKAKKTDGTDYPQTYTPTEVYANPPATVSFNGGDILLSNNVGKPVVGPMNIDVQSTGYFPSVYNARLKKWFIVTDENRNTFRPEEIQSRPYIVGTTAQGTGDKKQNVITFVPLTEERKKLVEAKLGNDAGKQPYKIKVKPISGDNNSGALDPKTAVTINGKTYTVEQLRQNPNNTDEVIKKFLQNGK